MCIIMCLQVIYIRLTSSPIGEHGAVDTVQYSVNNTLRRPLEHVSLASRLVEDVVKGKSQVFVLLSQNRSPSQRARAVSCHVSGSEGRLVVGERVKDEYVFVQCLDDRLKVAAYLHLVLRSDAHHNFHGGVARVCYLVVCSAAVAAGHSHASTAVAAATAAKDAGTAATEGPSERHGWSVAI